jgi:transposase
MAESNNEYLLRTLKTIAEYPYTDPHNMDAANMARLASAAIPEGICKFPEKEKKVKKLHSSRWNLPSGKSRLGKTKRNNNTEPTVLLPNIEKVFEAFQWFQNEQLKLGRENRWGEFSQLREQFKERLERMGLAQHIDWEELPKKS